MQGLGLKTSWPLQVALSACGPTFAPWSFKVVMLLWVFSAAARSWHDGFRFREFRV